jgi:alpha-2-macroglobulin
LVDVTEISKQRGSPDYGNEDEYFDDIVQPQSINAQGGGAYGAPAPSFAAESATYAEADIAPQAKQKVASKTEGSSTRRRPAASGPLEIRRPKVELRNYFPETWLFDLVELDSNGEKTLPLEAPHTITTWVAETVCTDTINGAQVSEEANLLVTQDFFADLNMPYSIKRGEKFPLNVSIFNTIEHRLPMTVTLKKSQQFKVGREKQSVCLQPKDNQIQSFTVKAKELHEVNITVEAKISSSDNVGCNDNIGSADGYSDTIQKSIQVKPEGFPVEKVDSEFVCRNANDEETSLPMSKLELPGPSELVNGSARAWTTVTGDIMAPALSNLEKLLRQPTGCGEQVKSLYITRCYIQRL